MSDRFAWLMFQAVFAISGAAALGYEVVWGRWLATVLGGSTLAACVVLSCYMGGLAAGAWVFGTFSARLRRPAAVYAGVELLIAVAACGFPLAADVIVGLPLGIRVVASVLVLLVPTFLMGGTLPLVLAWTERRGIGAGVSLGRLYGLNTLGAAVGCLLAGLWLIPTVGLALTNALGAVANTVIAGVVVLTVGLTIREPVPTRTEAGAEAAPIPWPSRPLFAVAFLSGLATLGIEVLWVRLLRITMGSTTYVFTLVVATFILGIGLGGFWAGRKMDSATIGGRLVRGQVLLVGLLALQFAALPYTAAAFAALQEGRGHHGALLGAAAVCAVLLLPVTTVVGYLFPVLGRLYMQRGPRGREIGRLYLVNTTGAVVGSVGTTLALVPMLGTAWSFLTLLGLMVVSAGIYLWLERPTDRRVHLAAAGTLLLVAIVAALAPGWGPTYLGRGAGWAGSAGTTVLYFEEGRTSTVLVEDAPKGRTIRIDGKPVASTVYQDKANQYLLGHLPALLADKLDAAVVVGMGTGMTTGALGAHGPERLVQVELEPAVVEGARHFADQNHGIADNPHLTYVFDDGYNHLNGCGPVYDVITSDPIQPFFRGAATLYSTEYFALSRQALTPGGVMAHWLPLGNLGEQDFKMIVRSFTDAFPYARMYWTGAYSDAILVGRASPWNGTAVVAERYPAAAGDLAEIYIDTPEELASLLVADRAGLVAWAGDGVRNTVDLPRLEFTSPLSLYADTRTARLADLLALRRKLAPSQPGWREVSLVLGFKVLVEPRRGPAGSAAFLRQAAGCQAGICPAARRSGLLRRNLWLYEMKAADANLERYFAPAGQVAVWWAPDSNAGAADELDLERALTSYVATTALGVGPQEKTLLRGRLARTLALLEPDSRGAQKVRSLQAQDREGAAPP